MTRKISLKEACMITGKVVRGANMIGGRCESRARARLFDSVEEAPAAKPMRKSGFSRKQTAGEVRPEQSLARATGASRKFPTNVAAGSTAVKQRQANTTSKSIGRNKKLERDDESDFYGQNSRQRRMAMVTRNYEQSDESLNHNHDADRWNHEQNYDEEEERDSDFETNSDYNNQDSEEQSDYEQALARAGNPISNGMTDNEFGNISDEEGTLVESDHSSAGRIWTGQKERKSRVHDMDYEDMTAHYCESCGGRYGFEELPFVVVFCPFCGIKI